MTRSIFDPTGNPERSGSSFTPPDADQISQMPDHFTNPTAPVPTGNIEFQPSAPSPAIDVSPQENAKVLVIRMTGKLHKEDYQYFVPVVEKAVQEHGKVRLLVEMHNFHGWDAGALWEDVKFDLKYFSKIERLAMVGEKTWEKWMAAFCKPFTTATIRYFPSNQAAEARAWIAE